MSNSSVSANSTVDEIESEKIFLTVCIETLDRESADYESQLHQYEAQVDLCNNLLAAKAASHSHAQPSTPQPSHQGSEMTLPSRDRPGQPPGGAFASTSRPHHSTAKRPLPRGAPLQSRKMQRTYSGSLSTTSASDMSEDEHLIGRRQNTGTASSVSDRYNAERQRAEQFHRAAEARFKQEADDRRFAQQLSAEPDERSVSNTPGLSQSFLGSTGALQRPSVYSEPANPAPLVFPPTPPRSNARLMPSTNSESVPFSEFRPVANQPSTPAPSRGFRVSTSPSTSDDDVEFLGSVPARPPGLSAPHTLSTHRQGAAQGRAYPPSMPGSYPSSPYVNFPPHLNAGQMISSSQQTHGAAGTSVFGGSSAFPGQFPSQYPQYPYMMGQYASGGPSNGTPSASPRTPAFGSGDYSQTEIDELRERGMFSLLYDPSRSKEEVMKLLESIRPDEEIPPEQRVGSPRELSCVLMEHQKLGLSWLKKQEEGPNKGSILADDMGLGKTIQALALMLARRSSDVAVKTTLIIAPVALMRQWKKEIESKVIRTRQLSVFILHGPGNKARFSQLSKYDVVLTTYGKLAYEWKDKSKFLSEHPAGGRARIPQGKYALLGDECTWYRVILDEAQAIKNRSTLTSNAANHLKAHFRLCITGTPMMNNVEEFFSLIRFLKIPPYNIWDNFNRDLARPISGRANVTSRDSAIKRLQAVVKALLLRRNKDSKVDGKPILSLPPRVTEVKHAVFSDDQRQYYNALETHSQVRFNSYLKAGTVNKNYTSALVLLLRLRQCCDHPHLIKDHSEEANGSPEAQTALAEQFSDEAVAMVKAANGAFECPICYDAADNPTIFFPCGHDVCAECFTRLSDPSNAIASGDDRLEIRCPECRSKIDVKKILSYSVFKRVRLTEMCNEEELKAEAKAEPEEEDSSDDDDEESDDESEADSQGDLRDFIVADDADIDAEDDDDDSDGKRAVAKAEESEDEEETAADERKTGRPRKSGKKDKSRGKKGKARSKSQKPKLTLAQLKAKATRNTKLRKKYFSKLRKSWVTSAKLEKTMEILEGIREEDAHEKTIIFSQFTTFLDLLEVPIADKGWKSTRYDGSMTPADRNAAVDRFEEEQDCNIMLISLKAGNAGLNLNWASQVIILDPFWNPFIEEQAIDRAHRIGQQRKVMVHRILIQETVEDRIVALQEKKRDLVTAALDENAGKSLSRLGVRQLAYLFGLGGNAPPPDDA